MTTCSTGSKHKTNKVSPSFVTPRYPQVPKKKIPLSHTADAQTSATVEMVNKHEKATIDVVKMYNHMQDFVSSTVSVMYHR